MGVAKLGVSTRMYRKMGLRQVNMLKRVDEMYNV